MVDFSSLLSRPAGDAKKPTPLPAGDYTGVITKWEPGEARNDNKTPLIAVTAVANGWPEDVDASEFQDIELAKRPLKKDFWMSEDAMYRLDGFIRGLGIDPSGRSYGEVLPEIVGQPVVIVVKQIMKKDNSGDYVSVCDDLRPVS